MKFFRRLRKKARDRDRKLNEMSERVDDLRAIVAILVSNLDEIEPEVRPLDSAKER